MRNYLKGILFSVVLIFGVSSVYAIGAVCTSCKVSSTAENNDGHCRKSVTGDVCYDNGSGPGCSENISEECLTNEH